MKILYQNRNPDLWQGGDQIQLEKTMEAMRKLGHTVEFNGTPVYKPALALLLFDIVHNFNFSMQWSKYQIWCAKNARRKIVSSMIYHESDAFVSYEDQQIMFDNLDAAIFLTEGEVLRAKRHLKIDDEKVHIIPNGIDSWWFKVEGVVPPEIPPFALTVGRIEPSKGQLEAAIASKRLGLAYVAIGQIVDAQYAERCAGEGAILLKPMPHNELVRFYRSCKVFVLSSRAEVMPLTVMEAGSQAANIVLTNHCEWQIPNTEYVEYRDIDAIEKAIQVSLTKPANEALKKMLSEMTWENVALQIEKIYKEILL